jgi:hypothetical protein
LLKNYKIEGPWLQKDTQLPMYHCLSFLNSGTLIVIKELHKANLHEMKDILVSGVSGWLGAQMAG